MKCGVILSAAISPNKKTLYIDFVSHLLLAVCTRWKHEIARFQMCNSLRTWRQWKIRFAIMKEEGTNNERTKKKPSDGIRHLDYEYGSMGDGYSAYGALIGEYPRLYSVSVYTTPSMLLPNAVGESSHSQLSTDDIAVLRYLYQSTLTEKKRWKKAHEQTPTNISTIRAKNDTNNKTENYHFVLLMKLQTILCWSLSRWGYIHAIRHFDYIKPFHSIL